MQQLGQWNSTVAWLAAFSEERSEPNRASRWNDNRPACADILTNPGCRALYLLDAPADWSPELAQAEGCRIIFDGILHNRAELHARFVNRLPHDPTNADLVAQAYRCWGEDALLRVKGSFALIIWDSARDLLLCARDPLGVHPLFYAELARTLLLSPSIETLLGHPDVSAELNRAGLVDYLARRWLKRDETYFTHVSRVPPGYILRLDRDGRHVYRYWDPVPPDRRIEWIPDEEAQERFDALLGQAVARRLALGPAGIYLSGGLDSSTVATVAADICQHEGWAPPWALSVVFPQPYDEQGVGRGVATSLGIPQVLLPFDEAAGPEGILAAGLELSRTLPAPLFNIWAPAYMRLSLEAQRRGCKVILTGEGGDEWLGVSPLLVADMLRSADLLGIYRLWRTYSRSYPSVNWAKLRVLLWGFGARPVLRDAWCTSAVGAAARRLLPRRGRLAATSAAGTMPWIAPEPWIAPDPTLRAQVVLRLEESRRSSAALRGTKNAYLQGLRSSLDAPQPGLRTEETFLLGRHTGVRMHDPLWDADLIDFLVRTRPHVRNRDGISKALVRSALARRFPGMGFERQRKSPLGTFIQSVTAAETGRAFRALGHKWVLGELGVVDGAPVSAFLNNPPPGKGWRVWDTLNLEAWARAHR